MHKIFSILVFVLLFFVATPQKAFSLTYDKKTNKQFSYAQQSNFGYAEEEGYFGKNNSDFKNCKELNANYSGMRQGKRISYDNGGKLVAIETGIFDCAYNADNKHALYMMEGIIEYHNRNSIALYFKTDYSNLYIYEKTNGTWYYYTKNKNYPAPPPTNIRLATQQETQHAERLYSFYKNIDLHSPSAKIYSVINNDLNPTSEKRRTEETRNETSSTYWSNTRDGPTDLESAKKKIQGRKLDLLEGIWYGNLGSILVFKEGSYYKVYLIQVEDRRFNQFNGTWEATVTNPISSSQYNFYSRIWYNNSNNEIVKIRTQKGRATVSKNNLAISYDQLSESGRNLDSTFVRFWPQDIEKYNLNFSGVNNSSSKKDCVGTYNKTTWNNCYGFYKWPSGDKYDGFFVNGERSGYGTYIWADGAQYTGNFKDNKPNGRGTGITKGGDKYIGDYKDGNRHGNGTYVWSGGDIFTGEWRDGERYNGTYTYSDGRTLKGKWKNGKYVGSDKYQETKFTDNSTSVKNYENTGKSNQIKDYWWVVVLLIGAVTFVYTQTKGDLIKYTKVSIRKEKNHFSDNYFIKFFYGKESLIVSFWIMFVGGSSVFMTIIYILLINNSENFIIFFKILWLLYYIYAVIGTWRSANYYKISQISKREGYGLATTVYVILTTITAVAILDVLQDIIK